MKTKLQVSACLALALMIACGLAWASGGSIVQSASQDVGDLTTSDRQENQMIQDGRQIFRHDSFGSEKFWGGQLRLHEALAKTPPATALRVGLKVDVEALSQNVIDQLASGNVNLNDPAVTLLLLQQDAVVGVKGVFDDSGKFTSVGITCALCHSTVDDSLAPGVGRRLDGWANRDLNVGRIITLAPTLQPFATLLGISETQVRRALNAWGPGKFDAELTLDGKAFRPDGKTAAVLIPPAFGLAGVNLHTWTGWGSIPYWNAFVANLEMHGQGNFFDSRLDDAEKFPVAARARLGHVSTVNENTGEKVEDLITPKLAALHFYQLSLTSPAPPADSFDANMAAAGEALFNDKANCHTCHVPPLFTDPGWNMHFPSEIGVDDFQANRAPDGAYRTTPLRGLWTRTKGGFFHDGRFPTLKAVVNHYNQNMNLGLSEDEKNALVEYLKSI